MQFSRLPACDLPGLYYRLFSVIGICAILLAADVRADQPGISSDVKPATEAAEKSTRKKRIKRLKLADPESTEVMLAVAESQIVKTSVSA